MHVDVITEPAMLDALRDDWDRLYARDPEAQFFLSWTWLSKYLRIFDGSWFILAARQGGPGAPYVGLMPLRLRTRMNKKTGLLFNEINMAGNYAADYTGALCAPKTAIKAMQAFARHLMGMGWTRIHLENVRMSRARLQAFLDAFPNDILALREFSRVNKPDNVDNCRCFAATLPDSFEVYLDKVLSTNNRQKLKRFLRKVDAGELRITHADASTFQRDSELLFDFWRQRWGARKGARLQSILGHNRLVLRNNFEAGTLFLPVLWQGDRPLGALATFVDPVKKTMLFYIAGRDETVTSIPVGLILHGHSIRHGIENGFATYDFLRGDEPYKLAFGVTESKIDCAMIYTRSGRNIGDRLDPRSLDAMYVEVNASHEQGHLARAESGYRQILATNPMHGRTLYGLGQLVSAKGDHREARDLYARLVGVAPNASKVWFRLGAELQALEAHSEAVDAFRKSLALNDEFGAAQFLLAKSLAALERPGEAIEVLEDLARRRERAPGDALAIKGKAMLERLRQNQASYIMLTPQKKAAQRPAIPAL